MLDSLQINITKAQRTQQPVPISDKLFMNYLQCKYKGYLKLSGKTGIKGEYEKFRDGLIDSYRLRAREYLQHSNQIIPLTEAITTFKHLRKQKPAIATDISIVNYRHDLILDAIELASPASSKKLVYLPIHTQNKHFTQYA